MITAVFVRILLLAVQFLIVLFVLQLSFRRRWFSSQLACTVHGCLPLYFGGGVGTFGWHDYFESTSKQPPPAYHSASLTCTAKHAVRCKYRVRCPPNAIQGAFITTNRTLSHLPLRDASQGEVPLRQAHLCLQHWRRQGKLRRRGQTSPPKQVRTQCPLHNITSLPPTSGAPSG